MAFRLLPSTSAFSTHFKSIAGDVVEIMELLAAHFENPNDITNIKDRARAIEKRADESTAAAIRLLNVSFITPFDRDDIHYFVHKLDDIIDISEDVLKNMYLYGFTKSNGPYKKFASLLVEASRVLQRMIAEHLDPPRYSEAVSELKERLNVIENEGDEVFATAIRELFDTERDPIELMKQKDIIDSLERLTDKCRTVGNVIENILLKSH